MIRLLTKENIKEIVVEATLPVVVDVYASWCGPCKFMEPVYEEIAREYDGKYVFAKLNVDESRDLAIEYSITSIPTFLFIKNNTVIGRETGSLSKEDLLSKIREYLD
jgi:thioredoxin 1